jgi:hypothetical protein
MSKSGMQINQTAGRDLFIAGVLTFLAVIILFVIRDRLPYGLATMNPIMLIASVGIATIHSFYALAPISKLYSVSLTRGPESTFGFGPERQGSGARLAEFEHDASRLASAAKK